MMDRETEAADASIGGERDDAGDDRDGCEHGARAAERADPSGEEGHDDAERGATEHAPDDEPRCRRSGIGARDPVPPVA